ncbi:MAG: DUF485 domain-containing protein [Pirellulaceae bacterium]|nr:DUF485 domain-containing protein [Pirellulaceae bacterium]
MPAPPNTDSPERRFNTRLGLVLFVVYLTMYVGFVCINAFKADWMDMTAVAGLNLAIVYGFALIVIALVLALIYGMLCRAEPSEEASAGETE